jgi:hypothetical protein
MTAKKVTRWREATAEALPFSDKKKSEHQNGFPFAGMASKDEHTRSAP